MNRSKKTRTRLATVTALTLAAGLATAAYADSDRHGDRRVGQSAAAPGAGTASAELALEDVLARLRSAGYSDFREIEREKGRFEVKGRDARGDRVEIYVDAYSGEILKAKRDD